MKSSLAGLAFLLGLPQAAKTLPTLFDQDPLL
jgi:hypothetical protein